jgi:hypothetical protein
MFQVMTIKKCGKNKSRWTLRNDTGGQAPGDGRSWVRKSSKVKKLPIFLTALSF